MTRLTSFQTTLQPSRSTSVSAPARCCAVLGLLISLPMLGWAAPLAGLRSHTVVSSTVVAVDTVGDLGDVSAAQLATITTDTGIFAPGWRDFSRYTLPGMCRTAAMAARGTEQRSLAVRNLRDLPGLDTIGLGTAARVAQACGARFTLANTKTPELSDLFYLALYEQNDSLAQAILVGQHGFWEEGLRQFLAFGHLAAAKALMTQADAQPGADDQPLRSAMHILWREFDRQQDTLGTRLVHDDSVQIQDAAARPDRPNGFIYMLEAYRSLMAHTLRSDTAAVAAVAHAAQHDLGQFRVTEQPVVADSETNEEQFAHPEIMYMASAHDAKRDRGTWATFPLDTVISRLAPMWYSRLRYGGGLPASRLRTDFLWLAPGAPASDTILPVPGKVNLICDGGMPSSDSEEIYKSYSEIGQTWSAYRQALFLKRWLAQYGPAGLVVTVVRPADGSPFVRYNPTRREGYFVPVTDSADEAAFWRWYDQTYHALPVNEAVKVVHTTKWLPAPDGRRLTLSEGTPNGYFDFSSAGVNDATSESYNGFRIRFQHEPGKCTLIGRDGTVLFRHDDSHDQDDDWRGWGEILAGLFTRPITRAESVVAPTAGSSFATRITTVTSLQTMTPR